MASKLLVAVAVFAVCQSSPVDKFRGKRSYTAAIGSSIGYAGKNTASAVVAGDKADAQAVNENGDTIARDALGNGLPSQAYAKAGTFENAGEAGFRGYAHPAYYHIPAPATVHSYQKYAEPEIPSHIVYEAPAPSRAQSSAVINGGYGSADSNAASALGAAASNANALGSGQSAVSSLAQSDGPVQEEPVVIAAKDIYTYAPVGYNSASSNANVNGYYGSANSAARVGAVPTRKSISWRFGTAYDHPAAYGAAKAAAANFGHGSAAARSDISNQGSLSSAVNTYGPGSAQSAATNNGYGSSVKSATNTFGAGAGSANAHINPHYAAPRSEHIPVEYGGLRSTAASRNGGSAISKASTDLAGNEYVDTAARSNIGGSAQSAAYNNGGSYGLRSNGAWGGRTGSNSYTNGQGIAVSSARNQGLNAGYRAVNTNANSDAFGSAHSNAYSL